METFMTEYAKQLEAAVRAYPQDYGWSVDELHEVLPRMRDSIRAGTFSKEGRAFRATCKALKIAHTYKAIRHFIDNHK